MQPLRRSIPHAQSQQASTCPEASTTNSEPKAGSELPLWDYSCVPPHIRYKTCPYTTDTDSGGLALSGLCIQMSLT